MGNDILTYIFCFDNDPSAAYDFFGRVTDFFRKEMCETKFKHLFTTLVDAITFEANLLFLPLIKLTAPQVR